MEKETFIQTKTPVSVNESAPTNKYAELEQFVVNIEELITPLDELLENSEMQEYSDLQKLAFEAHSKILDIQNKTTVESNGLDFKSLRNDLSGFIRRDLPFSTPELLALNKALKNELLLVVYNSEVFKTSMLTFQDLKNKNITNLYSSGNEHYALDLKRSCQNVETYLKNLLSVLYFFKQDFKP